MVHDRASRRQAPPTDLDRSRVRTEERPERVENVQPRMRAARVEPRDADTGRDDPIPQHRAMDAEEVFYELDEEALLDAGALVDAGQSLDVDEPMEADLADQTGDPDGDIHRQESWRRRGRRRPD